MSKSTFQKYASIILEASVGKELDYGVPCSLIDKISCGVRVMVPLRGRPTYGYVSQLKDTSNFTPVQAIMSIASTDEMVTKEIFTLASWMSKYYCAPLDKVLKTILPASIRKHIKHKEQLFVMRAKTKEAIAEHCVKLRESNTPQALVLDVMLKVQKGILLTELLEETGGSRSPVDTLAKQGFLKVDIVRVDRSPLVDEEYFQSKPKKLNTEQLVAYEKIEQSLKLRKFETHLLYGVTGSGKTEIYLQAIERALEADSGTIMLVPEIALTQQTIERFRSRFEGTIAILHHRLSHGERFDAWQNILTGKTKIAIGARSAVFCPMKNLGLIIVDEEHEQSYKQTDESPCYNARDMAILRGSQSKATVILGSATPSIESYRNALEGKYTLSKLTLRPDSAKRPTVKIVDMKKEYDKAKGFTSFSEELIEGIKKRRDLGEQSILFLNRRGYHTSLMCKQCGETLRCRHCDVSMTFHKSRLAIACHMCGYHISPPPRCCLSCKSPDPLQFKGVGTEQVEKALYSIFPDISIIRLDADTTRHKGSHQKLLREFGTGKADVLIGTQMIAKGLHFPQVTLVGVLNSDAALNIPDFRASEVVFQLITQVAGRAGRGTSPGEVIIQTCLPENATILHASKQDYDKFYEEEIAVRELFRYPPFSSMVKINFSGTDEKKVLEWAHRWQGGILPLLPKSCEVYPVVTAGHAKVKDRYRYQFLVVAPTNHIIIKAIDVLKVKLKTPSTLRILIDVNPVSTYF